MPEIITQVLDYWLICYNHEAILLGADTGGQEAYFESIDKYFCTYFVLISIFEYFQHLIIIPLLYTEKEIL